MRAWTLVGTQATIVQVLCVPVQEEEGEGLAPRDTHGSSWRLPAPWEAWGGAQRASWSQGEEGGRT